MKRPHLALAGGTVAACTIALCLPIASPASAGSGASSGSNTSSRTSSAAAATSAASSTAGDYVVLYRSGAKTAAARSAITSTGARLVSDNATVGYAVVRASAAQAAAIGRSSAVDGVARDRVIGHAPQDKPVDTLAAERAAAKAAAKAATSTGQGARSQSTSAGASSSATSKAAAAVTADPLAGRQWDMRQIGATTTGSYAKQQGKQSVLVGVIDTGVDGTHPDVAPNFDAARSRNFVTDLPDIDGPCEHPSCVDPANEDDDGHGTHVASTIAAPLNGIGIAGVAPNVRVVNIRAGQDSGYFFLAPTLNAITYAGAIGVDVINMSFYVDPWLFNCTNNPADSPAQQQEQRVIRVATQRALNYARSHGVLPVAASGNESTDLGHPVSDDTSPDYPPDSAYLRTIDNSCINVPAESNGVVAVNSTGPTERLAYYSDYGTEQSDVAAPGGDAYDTPLGTLDATSIVLAAYPKNVGIAEGNIDPTTGDITPDGVALGVQKDCRGTVCGYYQFLQGTSMASPHAVGVAALIVSQFGHKDRKHGGLTLDPRVTERKLYASATPHACPSPRTFTWTRTRTTGEVAVSTATCQGPLRDNGFYGHGIVNAYPAVSCR